MVQSPAIWRWTQWKMKLRVFIIVLVVLCLGLGAVVLVRSFSRNRMPVYQGRSAQEWLGEVFTTNQGAALHAFRTMGTNALPVVLHAFEKRDSAWDKFYQKKYPQLPARCRSICHLRWRMICGGARQSWFSLIVAIRRRQYRSCPECWRIRIIQRIPRFCRVLFQCSIFVRASLGKRSISRF